MALSMANQTPIVSTATAALKPGVVPTGDSASSPVLAVDLEGESVEQDNSLASESESQEPEELCTNHSEEQPTAEPIEVKGKNISIQVKGSTVFGSDEIEEAVTPIIEKFDAGKLPEEEFIKEINERITQLYLEKGYITSRAKDHQGITNNIVEIKVIEGSLRKIEIKGRKRLNKNYICSRIGLGVGIPLNTNQLEEQLRLLRSNPLLENVEASLLAAEEGKSDLKGKSDLIVTVTEAAPLVLNLNIDNYSPPSVGSERLEIGLLYRNLTGSGDELSAAYSRSTTGGAEVFDLSWKVPVNPMEGTLLVRVAPNRNEVTQSEFQALGIRGERELYEIFFRQPLMRTTREELALSVGFSYQDGQTFLFDREPFGFGIGPDEDGVSRTSVFKFGQDYVRRDRQGAWSLRSEFSFGTNLFDATTNEGSIPDGQFFSWLGQVQRVQRLGEEHLLVMQADLQLTPDSLLPAHQFVIGGGQSLRGYRQNARSGDNGFRFSIEDRFTILRDEGGEARLQIVPFVDLGAIWNRSGNPNVLPDQTFLLGAGLGLRWLNAVGIDGLSFHFDYAFPFFNLDEQGGNIQDEGFYFQVNYQQNLDLFGSESEGE
ncbi:MAG: ShlB/FhaC/HecB family hemolysin secretion/activation protein [Symploca sp. SIO3E6]|nr:ShlB/FhaC/HecB family hemolysin secretion/activation protein [Caldora sp. SIO3E6]